MRLSEGLTTYKCEKTTGNFKSDTQVDREWTMKYFRKRGTAVFLEAANKDYLPIHPQEELQIAAVVRAVIRKY